MGKNTRVPEGKEFETRGDTVAKRAAEVAIGRRRIPGDGRLRDAFEDLFKDKALIKAHGGTDAMKSKSFATKRYMKGGAVMSGRGVRDTKMS